MDGNRRFAKQHRIEAIEGHNLGFEALARLLEVCYRSGVQVVTIFAFSVENFKRPRREVGGLMEMARLKLDQLSQHGDLLNQYGACIQIIGQTELVPPDVQASVNRAVGLTAGNDRAILNVCFPYTSRDEITTVIKAVVAEWSTPLHKGRAANSARPFSEHSISQNIRTQRLSTLKEEEPSSSPDPPTTNGTSSPATSKDDKPTPNDALSTSSTLTQTPSPSPSPEPLQPQTPLYRDPESITIATLDSRMYTAAMPPVDLLVRTSGVSRLSDFLLWQCHEGTTIRFLDCLWPEFGLLQFLPVLVEWQWWRIRAAKDAGEERVASS